VANLVYPAGIQALTGTSRSWNLSSVRVVACNSGYTFDDTHQTLSDIPAVNRVALSALMAGKTNTGGVHDAQNGSMSGVSEVFDKLVIYIDLNTESLSPLLMHIDTVLDDQDAEIPIAVDPTNADVTLEWNPSGIWSWIP